MKPLALVIEDSEDVAIVFHTAMERAGFESEIISDGAVALERLAEIVPDLVILDLHLPGVSGEQILKFIRFRFKDLTVKTSDHIRAGTTVHDPFLMVTVVIY